MRLYMRALDLLFREKRRRARLREKFGRPLPASEHDKVHDDGALFVVGATLAGLAGAAGAAASVLAAGVVASEEDDETNSR